MSRRLLVVGASGSLGRRVAEYASAAGWQVIGTYHHAPRDLANITWQPLDIRDAAAVRQLLGDLAPDAVVHTAIHPRLAGPGVWAVNAGGAASVAAAMSAAGARLVHISSDAIFDGRDMPYTEDDDPSPINLYGASKAAAETAVGALVPSAAIVRTSLIIDDDPIDKHSQMILDIAAGRRPEALFTDEIRCPVAARDLAAAVVELLSMPVSGLINVVGADAISRYELGVLVAQRYGVDPRQLRTATLAESGLRRPGVVRLEIGRARSLLRTRMRGAREFLEAAPTA